MAVYDLVAPIPLVLLMCQAELAAHGPLGCAGSPGSQRHVPIRCHISCGVTSVGCCAPTSKATLCNCEPTALHLPAVQTSGQDAQVMRSVPAPSSTPSSRCSRAQRHLRREHDFSARIVFLCGERGAAGSISAHADHYSATARWRLSRSRAGPSRTACLRELLCAAADRVTDSPDVDISGPLTSCPRAVRPQRPHSVAAVLAHKAELRPPLGPNTSPWLRGSSHDFSTRCQADACCTERIFELAGHRG